jgi:hypothetical protein
MGGTIAQSPVGQMSLKIHRRGCIFITGWRLVLKAKRLAKGQAGSWFHLKTRLE